MVQLKFCVTDPPYNVSYGFNSCMVQLKFAVSICENFINYRFNSCMVQLKLKGLERAELIIRMF